MGANVMSAKRKKLSRLSCIRGLLVCLMLGFCTAGCATYTTPAAGVSLAAINDYQIEDAYKRMPAANFPASLVVARVQAAGYAGAAPSQGRYSVVTKRDVEADQDLETLAGSPAVRGLATLTQILLPAKLTDTRDLRISAAQLKADLLLLYSIDTGFRTDVGNIGPLQTLSLGFFPNRKAFVDASASVLLVDVRTGYVYGTAEATATQTQRSDFWGSKEAIEKARFKAERAAFVKVVKRVEVLLEKVHTEYAAVGS